VPTSMTVAEFDELVSAIPLGLVEKLVLWGDEDRIAGSLAEYETAGVDHAVLWNVTGMGEATGETIRDSFGVLRRVKDRLRAESSSR
jgi:hypothetical protein